MNKIKRITVMIFFLAMVFTPTLAVAQENDSKEQISEPTNTMKFKQLATGRLFQAGLTEDGRIIMWGTNRFGQFGLGYRTENKSEYTEIGGGSTDWEYIQAGSDNAMFGIKKDGTMWRWGAIYHYHDSIDTPIQIGKNKKWKKIVGESEYAYYVALAEDGSLWKWVDCKLVQIGKDNDWKDIDGGHNYFAVKKNGSLWAWGTSYKKYPIKIMDNFNAKCFSVGYKDMYFINEDGTLWAFINPNVLENKTGVTKPIQIGSDKDWSLVQCNYRANFAIKKDGNLWSWGEHDNGALRFEKRSEVDNHNPTRVSEENDWALLSHGGSEFSCMLGLKEDGSLWIWGNTQEKHMVYSHQQTDMKKNVHIDMDISYKYLKNLGGNVSVYDAVTVDDFIAEVTEILKLDCSKELKILEENKKNRTDMYKEAKKKKTQIETLEYKKIIDPLDYPSYDKPILRREAAKIIWGGLAHKYGEDIIKYSVEIVDTYRGIDIYGDPYLDVDEEEYVLGLSQWQDYRGNVSDIYDITPEWQKESILCYLTGIMKLDKHGEFKPYGFITTKEMDNILEILKNIKDKKEIKILKDIDKKEMPTYEEMTQNEKWLWTSPYVGKELYETVDAYSFLWDTSKELKEFLIDKDYEEDKINKYLNGIIDNQKNYIKARYNIDYAHLGDVKKTKYDIAEDHLYYSEIKQRHYDEQFEKKVDYRTRRLRYYSPIQSMARFINREMKVMWMDDVTDYDIEQYKKHKVVMQAELISDESLMYVASSDRVMGIVRFIYYPPTDQEYLKQNGLEVGKWYEKRVEFWDFGCEEYTLEDYTEESDGRQNLWRYYQGISNHMKDIDNTNLDKKTDNNWYIDDTTILIPSSEQDK
ncbi:RCC1 domain-containing protein [Vallitalea guaymasensis]|uniref:RCC1 domain-containing protein n=1 Tax=Vallitalea guaymasensis TaxID=1185412 RepID=UPI002356E3FA|nr:hypothetical protein [Vallitalea guaymasensis]